MGAAPWAARDMETCALGRTAWSLASRPLQGSRVTLAAGREGLFLWHRAPPLPQEYKLHLVRKIPDRLRGIKCSVTEAGA